MWSISLCNVLCLIEMKLQLWINEKWINNNFISSTHDQFHGIINMYCRRCFSLWVFRSMSRKFCHICSLKMEINISFVNIAKFEKNIFINLVHIHHVCKYIVLNFMRVQRTLCIYKWNDFFTQIVENTVLRSFLINICSLTIQLNIIG